MFAQPLAPSQFSAPQWHSSSNSGVCQLTRHYEETGQRIDIDFRSSTRASVFLSSEVNLIDVDTGDVEPVIEVIGADLGRFKPLILSPRKVVFEVFDAPHFLSSLDGVTRLRMVAGQKSWVYDMPAAGDLSSAYARCFSGVDLPEKPRVASRDLPVENVPAASSVLAAASMTAQSTFTHAPSPIVASLVPAASPSPVVTEEAEEPGFFDFVTDIFERDDSSSDEPVSTGGFERVSRMPPSQEKIMESQNEVISVADRTLSAPVSSLSLQSAFSSPQPTPSQPNSSTSPMRVAASDFSGIAQRSPALPIVDVGQSCAQGGAGLPPELQSMAGYIAHGAVNPNTESELIDSLKQKMMLLEREKEGLRAEQAEQPSPLSLVRVCTQEKTEMNTLAERLEALELRTFELSQQQLRDKIAEEDSALKATDEEVASLLKENEDMRERLQEAQAQLNAQTVEASGEEESSEDVSVDTDSVDFDFSEEEALVEDLLAGDESDILDSNAAQDEVSDAVEEDMSVDEFLELEDSSSF